MEKVFLMCWTYASGNDGYSGSSITPNWENPGRVENGKVRSRNEKEK